MSSWSKHAEVRSAQRRVSVEHVDLALLWGQQVRQHGGRIAYHLGDREAREALDDGVEIPDEAIGLAVVMADDGTVVTVVRSPDRARLRAHSRARSRRRRSRWHR